MTTEGSNTDQASSVDLVDSMASSSADLWNDVLNRLTDVQRSNTRLAEAVDHLAAVASTALAAEPESELPPPFEVRETGMGLDEQIDPGPPSHAGLVFTEAPEKTAEALPATSEPTPPTSEPRFEISEPAEGLVPRSEPYLEETEATQAPPWAADALPPTSEPQFEISEPAVGLVPRSEPYLEETEATQAPPWAADALPGPELELDKPAAAEEAPWAADAPLENVPSPQWPSDPSPPPSEAPQWPAVESSPFTAEPAPAYEERPERLVAVADSWGAPAFASDRSFEEQSAVRVLAPERVADMSPAVVDALLAVEFGEAAARLVDPDALTLDALLREEFGPREEEPEKAPKRTAESPRPSAATLLPPPPATSKLPPPPSQPLPPPPKNLLPPPPRSAITETSRPAPLAQSAPEPPGLIDPSTSYVSPPLTGVGAADEVSSDLPALSFDSPLFAESTLPVEPPPIPAPLTVDDVGDLEPRLTDVGAAGQVPSMLPPPPPPMSFDAPLATGVGAAGQVPSNLPPPPSPASFDSSFFTGEPTPQPVVVPARSVEGPSVELVLKDEFGVDEVAAGAAHSQSNVISQDFTIIGKKHRRFRLR